MSNIKKYIVIHYSDSDTGNAKSFEKYHKEVRGWPSLGYNYVIPRDGSIENLIGEQSKGSHAPNYNTNGVGICVVCTKDKKPNEDQLKTLTMLTCNIAERLNIPIGNIIGHKDTGANTDCPGPIDIDMFKQFFKP